MQRIGRLIAILFAFASLAGVTTAHAHRYVATPIVVLNHVDAENVPIRMMVKVQRGDVDLGEGIIMPCGSHYAIHALPPQVPMAPEGEDRPETYCAQSPIWRGAPELRPPIAS
jgi:hypothetical protein